MNYVEKLYNLLKEEETTYHDMLDNVYELQLEHIEKLARYIPTEVIIVLCREFDKITHKLEVPFSLQQFLAVASKMGMLTFSPRIIYVDRCPVLVLRYNRFVSLFRACYFQVSYSPEGMGEYMRANTRLDFIRGVYGIDFEDCVDHQMLFYMNCYNAAYGLAVFDTLVQSNIELLDSFVKKSWEYLHHSEYNVKFADIVQQFTPCHTLNSELLAKYNVPRSDTSDYCRLYVHEKLDFVIETMLNEAPVKQMFSITELFNNDIDDYDITLLMEDVYANPEILYTIVSFILNYNGIVINHLVVYPANKEMPHLRAINDPDFIKVETLNSFRK